jgi:hypothetical protein
MNPHTRRLRKHRRAARRREAEEAREAHDDFNRRAARIVAQATRKAEEKKPLTSGALLAHVLSTKPIG